MQWQTHAGSITTNFKVNIYFTLPGLSATDVLPWKCYVDDSAKGRYDIIVGRYIWTELVLNLKISDHVIEADDGPSMRSTAPMVYLCAYVFKDLNTGEIKLEESFTDAYAEELYES